MQRDVKIGIAIGVLLIALIGIFWWAKTTAKKPEAPPSDLVTLPLPTKPVAPVGSGPTAPALPEITLPGAPTTTITGMTPVAAVPGATVPVAPPVTVPAPVSEKKYKVQAGDSLARIAKQMYNDESKWKLIAEANKLAAPYKLMPNQELVIPEAAVTVKPPVTPGTAVPGTAPAAGEKKYKVQAGDSLAKIAKQMYNDESKWKLIAEANKLAAPYKLMPNQELVIPAER